MNATANSRRTSRLDFGDAEIVFGVLPFCQLSPALDASTLATMLKLSGIRTKVVYFNRVFAKDVSRNFYESAVAPDCPNSLIGDWVFRRAALGEADDGQYFHSLSERGLVSASLLPVAAHARNAVEGFLEVCLAEPDWSNVKVLCLVETFGKRDGVSGQLMSSLALARRLKSVRPDLKIVLAGPSVEREMGEALRNFAWLDFVCSDDVYDAVPRIITNLLEGRNAGGFPSEKGKTAATQQSLRHNARTLELPIPNFDDYFELRGDGLPGFFDTIPMRGSIGCWWAERSHCTFCALPGATVTFRSRAPDHFVAEFVTQLERYSPNTIDLHDLLLDQTYFEMVLPRLSSLNHKSEIFLQTKAHLSAEKISLLSRAGVRSLQVGIETLSPNTLKRVSKGLSIQRNIEFLSLCRNVGISCYWNYLHSFPGDSSADILEAIPIIAAIADVDPPSTFQPMRIERFSPYFKNSAQYGIEQIWPDRSYEYVYGNAGIDLERFALYHEHREQNLNYRERAAAVEELRQAVEGWRRLSHHPH